MATTCFEDDISLQEDVKNKEVVFYGLVAIGIEGEPIVVSMCKNCKDRDLFIDGTDPEYNAIQLGEDTYAGVGLYHVEFIPHCEVTMDGDHNFWITLKVIKKLSVENVPKRLEA